MVEDKVRVYYLSRELGVTNQQLIAYYNSIGLYPAAQSCIPVALADQAREYFETNGTDDSDCKRELSSDEMIAEWDNYVEHFMTDPQYWHIQRVLDECPLAVRYILGGNRKAGKSTAAVAWILKYCWTTGETFGLVRREDIDFKNDGFVDYFANMTPFIIALTHNKYNCVTVWKSKAYWGYEDGNKIERGPLLCYSLVLKTAVHYKSRQYPNCNIMVFEEFINKDGKYLQDEPYKLEELESTVFRDRVKVPGLCKVFLIGNTENRTAPYFTEWGLKDAIMDMGYGDIKTIRIHTGEDGEHVVETAIEICWSPNVNGTNAITKKGQTSQGGDVWTYDEHPRLDAKDFYVDKYAKGNTREEPLYEELYTVYLHDNDFHFYISLVVNNDTGDLILYVKPNTSKRIPESGRVITNDFSESLLTTNCLNVTIKAEKLMRDLFKMNKVAYSSNMTGEDFESIIKQRKGVL